MSGGDEVQLSEENNLLTLDQKKSPNDKLGSTFSSYPEVRILRGEEQRVETIQFTSKSLMSIIVNNTGTNAMISVIMRDNLGQIRYSSSSGGSEHEHVTRLQNTRSFGRWQLEISGLLTDEITKFSIKIPFFLVKKIDPDIIEQIYSPHEYDYHEIDQVDFDLKDDEKYKMDVIEPTERDSKPGSLLNELIKDELAKIDNAKPSLTIIRPEQFVQNEKSENLQDDEVLFSTEKKYRVEDQIFQEEDLIESNEHASLFEMEDPLHDILDSEEEKGDILLDHLGEQLGIIASHEKIDDEEVQLDDYPIEQEYDVDFVNDIGKENMERIRDLFIPLDEIQVFTSNELTELNKNNIFYLPDLIETDINVLILILNTRRSNIISYQQLIADIVSNSSNPIMTKYSQIGTVEDNTLYNTTVSLSEINGIGKITSAKLIKAGITNVTELADCSLRKVAEATGFSIKKSSEFLIEAKRRVYLRINLIDYEFEKFYSDTQLGIHTTNEQLDLISGIDLTRMNQLYGIGINNIEKLLDIDIIDLASKMQMKTSSIAAWWIEAQILIHNRICIQYRENSDP